MVRIVFIQIIHFVFGSLLAQTCLCIAIDIDVNQL